KYPSAALRQLQGKRATRLVTPGDGHAGSAATQSYTQDGGASSSARRRAATSRKVPQRIYRRRSSTVASRRETCETSSQSSGLTARAKLVRLARVKRWGKSPPSR